MQSFIARLMPFIVIGIFLVLLFIGLVIVSYILVIGALVGFVLFSIAWIKAKLFPPKEIVVRKDKQSVGRTFDHE